jgi:glycosyltransferase involved in cell wall biosynthesis
VQLVHGNRLEGTQKAQEEGAKGKIASFPFAPLSLCPFAPSPLCSSCQGEFHPASPGIALVAAVSITDRFCRFNEIGGRESLLQAASNLQFVAHQRWNRKMRIAQVAPLYESVPPKFYGGTERVVHYLTEEFIRQGHDVTLFASGDSITSGRLIAPCQAALRLSPNCSDPLAYHLLLLEEVLEAAADFDIVHFHIDYLHFPFSRRHSFRHVTTLHGRLDIPELQLLYGKFQDIPVVSISDAQRLPLLSANWQGTVHHGLPPDLLKQGDGRGGYLAFLGRISPEKRPDRAIEIARRIGMPLKIGAKVDRVDREYFEARIRPLLNDPLVEFIGEIGERDKGPFLGDAYALLFPIDWAEPFGLVLIEAMACGTPVVAFRGGSVDEIVKDGVTGFIVEDIECAVEAVRRVPEICRKQCRSVFESRFSASRMAADYLNIYTRMIEGLIPSPEAACLLDSVDTRLASASAVDGP